MRRSMWIAWLLLCLLPLRGWAQGGMPVGPALPPASTAAGVASVPAVAAALPCHETDAVSSSSSSEEDAAPAGTCTACDLCHVAALPAAGPQWPPLGVPRSAPSATPVPDTGRGDPDRLERPPRIGLLR